MTVVIKIKCPVLMYNHSYHKIKYPVIIYNHGSQFIYFKLNNCLENCPGLCRFFFHETWQFVEVLKHSKPVVLWFSFFFKFLVWKLQGACGCYKNQIPASHYIYIYIYIPSNLGVWGGWVFEVHWSQVWWIHQGPPNRNGWKTKKFVFHKVFHMAMLLCVDDTS